MSKAVLIRIKPEECDKIANKKQTIVFKKTRPKIDTPFKCYIYCAWGNLNMLYYDFKLNCVLNGKVIGEFVCDEIACYEVPFDYIETDCSVSLTKFACLSIDEVWEYGKGKTLYGWHISDLKIYDEPKELSEFYKPCPKETLCAWCKHALVDDETFTLIGCENKVTRPPQSWCYVRSW